MNTEIQKKIQNLFFNFNTLSFSSNTPNQYESITTKSGCYVFKKSNLLSSHSSIY